MAGPRHVMAREEVEPRSRCAQPLSVLRRLPLPQSDLEARPGGTPFDGPGVPRRRTPGCLRVSRVVGHSLPSPRKAKALPYLPGALGSKRRPTPTLYGEGTAGIPCQLLKSR